jgi:hypothetical protein
MECAGYLLRLQFHEFFNEYHQQPEDKHVRSLGKKRLDNFPRAVEGLNGIRYLINLSPKGDQDAVLTPHSGRAPACCIFIGFQDPVHGIAT